jgi:hypothetical protein
VKFRRTVKAKGKIVAKLKDAVTAYGQLQTVTQRSDQQGAAQAGLSPTGSSTLYMVNPENELTPVTTGYTTSKNQVTVSGK